MPPGPDLAALPSGSAIKFEKTYNDVDLTFAERVYTCVAVKAGRREAWYVSGSVPGLNGATDGELSEFIGAGRCWVLDVGEEITAVPSDIAGS